MTDNKNELPEVIEINDFPVTEWQLETHTDMELHYQTSDGDWSIYTFDLDSDRDEISVQLHDNTEETFAAVKRELKIAPDAEAIVERIPEFDMEMRGILAQRADA